MGRIAAGVKQFMDNDLISTCLHMAKIQLGDSDTSLEVWVKSALCPEELMNLIDGSTSTETMALDFGPLTRNTMLIEREGIRFMCSGGDIYLPYFAIYCLAVDGKYKDLLPWPTDVTPEGKEICFITPDSIQSLETPKV